MIFLYFILFVFLFILLLGVGIVNTIYRLLFGKRRPAGYESQDGRQQGGNQWDKRTNNTSNKKVFAEDEGEYIEFEEIKDK